MLSELRKINRILNEQRKIEKSNREYERLERLSKGNVYSIEMRFHESVNRPYEIFEVEGFELAIKMFEVYKGLAKKLKIERLVVGLDDEKFEKIYGYTVKYN